MTATFNVVTIDGLSYDVYADLGTADIYLGASSSAGAVAYRAETDPDVQGRWAVTATRILDRQLWSGTKTDADQEHAFPRTGISGVDSDTIPQAIIDAACELIAAQAAGLDVEYQASTENQIKRQKAGSVEQEFFRDIGNGTRLPLPVAELIAGLIGGTSIAGSLAFGTDACSDFEDDFEVSRAL